MSGFSVGILAGYFGIGGGFLIVPTIMYSGGLNIIQAIGTSLVSVSSFGLTTAARYFVAGQVDLIIAALLIIGGVVGGYFGAKTSEKIPKENLSKIFDPYFTTRPDGTGLGLSIVQKIIESHNGTIDVKSSDAEGTIFTISLPLKTEG